MIAPAIEDSVVAVVLSTIPGIEEAYLDDSGDGVQVYVVTPEHSREMSTAVCRASGVIAGAFFPRDIDTHVFTSKKLPAFAALVAGRKLDLPPR